MPRKLQFVIQSVWSYSAYRQQSFEQYRTNGSLVLNFISSAAKINHTLKFILTLCKFEYVSYVVFRILSISCSGLITSAGEERSIFFCYRILVILWFLLGGVSSNSWCFGGYCFIVPLP